MKWAKTEEATISIFQYGRTEVVEFLLKTPGVDVNPVNENGWTILYIAAKVSYN